MKEENMVEEPKTDDIKEEAQPMSRREEVEEMLTSAPVAIEDEEEVDLEVNETNETPSDLSPDEEDNTEESDDESEESEESEPLTFEDLLSPKKDGKQKRIDKLTARNKENEMALKALKDEIEILKKQTKDKPPTEYTDEQLKKAWDDAVAAGDEDLKFEIMAEMKNQAARNARKAYEEQAKTMTAEQKAYENAIATTRDQYSYLSDLPEIYEGSKKDLDINNDGSLLVQATVALLQPTEQIAESLGLTLEQAKARYSGAQGIGIAVSDALKIIVRRNKGLRPKDKEKETLKSKVKRSGKKSSISTSKSMKTETTSKPKSKSESFKEEIARRKKNQM